VAIGDIDDRGKVVPAAGLGLISAAWIAECRQFGIRRIIVPSAAEVEELGVVAAVGVDRPMPEIVRCGHVGGLLSEFFSFDAPLGRS
jgi:hypothetical protein